MSANGILICLTMFFVALFISCAVVIYRGKKEEQKEKHHFVKQPNTFNTYVCVKCATLCGSNRLSRKFVSSRAAKEPCSNPFKKEKKS